MAHDSQRVRAIEKLKFSHGGNLYPLIYWITSLMKTTLALFTYLVFHILVQTGLTTFTVLILDKYFVRPTFVIHCQYTRVSQK